MKDLIKCWYLIPTGEEILSGMVTDTNSPEIMKKILERHPDHKVCRAFPCPDDKEKILSAINEGFSNNYDLIVVMGGSGGGKKYNESYNPDKSHSAIIDYTSENSGAYHFIEIYGSNNHLFAKIVFSNLSEGKIINIPGPYQEAMAAIDVIINRLEQIISYDYSFILNKLAESILKTYPDKPQEIKEDYKK